MTLRLAQMFVTLTPKRTPLYTKSSYKDPEFFLLGSGRSGTTLLRSILNESPQVCIPPESHGAIPNAVKRYYMNGNKDWPELVTLLLHEFERHENFSFWKINMCDLKQTLFKTSYSERSVATIVNSIFNAYREYNCVTANLVGDKTPFNSLRLKWICKLYPSAKYLFVLRDPRGVVASFKASKLNERTEEVSMRWGASLKAFEKMEKKSPESTLLIRYEDLISKPEEVSLSIFKFLNIDFDPKYIAERNSSSGDGHQIHHKNSRSPLNNRSLEKWREILEDRDLGLILDKLSSQMSKYGYQ